MTVGQCERKPLVAPGLFLVVGLLLAACGGGGGSGPFIGAAPPSDAPQSNFTTPTRVAPSPPANSPLPSATPPPRLTNPPPRLTNPPPRLTNPPPRLTNPPPRLTNPPPRLTNPPPRLTNPPPRLTNPPPRLTNPPPRLTNPPPRSANPPPSDAPRNLESYRLDSLDQFDPVLVLQWRPPTINDGASILRYEYRIDGGEWQTADGTSTSYVFTDLDDDTSYGFQVRAVLEKGGVERYSAPSEELYAGPHAATPEGTPPGAPGNLVAYAGNGRVLLTWDAPDPGVGNPHGREIPGHIFYYLYQVNGVWRTTDDRHYTAQLVTGLVNGQSYTFTVKVVTEYAFSEASVSATPSAGAVTVPDKPTHVTATLDSSGWTDLVWATPVWDGSADITSYEYKGTGGTWQTLTTYEASDNHCPYRCRYISSVQGLAENDGVQVRARNSAGPGDASDVAQVRVPGLSVADAETQEAEGATVAFTVTLNRPDLTSATVTVDYATSDGTATAGSDYTETSGTLRFGLGETAKTITVPVLDDTIDDAGETFTLVLSNAVGAVIADGEATGTILNSDLLPQAWLARFGRTVATHVTDAVSERVRGSAALSSHVTVGGYRLPLGKSPGATEAGADRLALGTGLAGLAGGPGADRPGTDLPLGRTRTINLRDILLGSSFRLTLGATDDTHPGAMRLTAWGRVAGTRFNGQERTLSLDGDVLTGTLGVDGEWDRWLAGVAVAHSRGDGSFSMTGGRDRDSGELDNTLTSIHPYLRYAVTERLDVWGVLGYGWGELTLEQGNGVTLETDTTLVMGAFGGRGVLLSAAETGGFELAMRTDAMLTRMTSEAVTGGSGNLASADADAHRVRLVLEGSRGFTWAEGRVLTPSVELGLRHDWGDAETGFGLELGGRVRYADSGRGLTLEGAVRGLLAHEDSDYEEWSVWGTLRVDPGAAGQGLSLTLAPAWGAAASGVDGLWSRQDMAGLAQNNQRAQTGRLNAEVGYGVAAFGAGRLTPYAGTVLADGADRTYRVGTRLYLPGRGVTGLGLSMEGMRQEGRQPLNQGVRLQATWNF